jgi:hypothetical protein
LEANEVNCNLRLFIGIIFLIKRFLGVSGNKIKEVVALRKKGRELALCVDNILYETSCDV